MATRELRRPPRMLGLYCRAAAGMLPGASRLPLLPGGGGPIPELTLTLADVPIDPDRLSAYRQVCGYRAAAIVPPTYPHVLAFPLHMALMTDAAFPFAAVGLVHVENEIAQHRTLEPGERLALSVVASQHRAHPRGLTFDVLTTTRVEGRVVWEERSRMLRREGRADVHAGVQGRARRQQQRRSPVRPSERRDGVAGAGRHRSPLRHPFRATATRST